MEPSIPCGTIVKYGTPLHCVECRKGTYSNSYSRQQCTPCSLCSVGRTVTRNCSASKNTLCGPCSYGYYMNDVVFSCLPCSICCWDGRDTFESQCKAQGLPKHRQCAPRHEDSCQTSTTTKANFGGTIVITNPITTQRTRTRLTGKTITTVPISPTKHEQLFGAKTQDDKAASSAVSTTASQLPVTVAGTTNNVANGKARKSVLDNSKNETRIIMGTCISIAVLILIVVFAKRNKIANCLKWARCRPICRSKDAELDERTESSMLDDVRAPVTVERKGGT